jgi:hypothetical protein
MNAPMSETTFASRRLRKTGTCNGRQRLVESGFDASPLSSFTVCTRSLAGRRTQFSYLYSQLFRPRCGYGFPHGVRCRNGPLWPGHFLPPVIEATGILERVVDPWLSFRAQRFHGIGPSGAPRRKVRRCQSADQEQQHRANQRLAIVRAHTVEKSANQSSRSQCET